VALCLRIRFSLGLGLEISSSASEVSIADSVEGKTVILKAERESTFTDSKHISLVARPFQSDNEAERAAERWIGVLKTAFTRVNIGADFGDRAPKSVATVAGLEMLEAQSGRRVLNDTHGVSIYECEPQPLFARGEVSAVVGKELNRVLSAIDLAIDHGAKMTANERLSYDLFAASSNERSADARFVMLMMAVETLIDPKPRASAVRAHVDALIEATEQADISKAESQSIAGTLRWARKESVGQAGRKLAARLGTRTYMNGVEPPTRFFTRCYELRSALVHGRYPRPSREEISDRAASLERFVADLLSLEIGGTE